jgi:hypothetical protein
MNLLFWSSFLIESFILTLFPTKIESELFTSTFQMKNLVITSSNVTKEFEAYFDKNYLNNEITRK